MDPDVAIDLSMKILLLTSGQAAPLDIGMAVRQHSAFIIPIYGDALIRSQKPDVTVPPQPDGLRHTSITIFDSDTADALARALYNQGGTARCRYHSRSKMRINRGCSQVPIIRRSRILVRIIDRTITRGSALLYSYTATGCAAISTTAVRRSGYVGSMVNRPPIIPRTNMRQLRTGLGTRHT